MIRKLAAGAVVVVLVGACGSSAKNNEREVLVDFSPDEVTTFVAANYPKKVSVLPGQTVAFKQTWTGEPHTITGGTSVNEKLKAGSDFLTMFNGYFKLRDDNKAMVNVDDPGDATIGEFTKELKSAKPAKLRNEVLGAYGRLTAKYGWPNNDNSPDVPFSELNTKIEESANPIFDSLLFAFDDEEDNLAQNVSQPCYLNKGEPPEEPGKACTKAQQKQTAFDGTQTFYNSGIIRYEGARGNTFRMEIAETTKPGTYFFYCAVHGPGQLSEITVLKKGSKVPSASEVRRAARDEATEAMLPLENTYRKAVRTGKATLEGEELSGPFAGLPTSSSIHGSINEFVPRTIRAKVNEPITWKMIGAEHSISFDVPRYLPIIQFGTKFRLNPKVQDPAGGAPKPPRDEEGAGGEGGEGGGERSEKIPSIDGGTYDGEGFWSTGLVGGGPYLNYTLRISKPGNYPYACLIHPKMIGKVIVT